MKSWKQAFWLAKSEWKVSIVNIFLSWLILTIVTLIFLTSFNRYMEENYIGFDIFFLLVFSFGPFLFRSKYFQYKKVSGHIWASPTLIMQAQLPIPKNIRKRTMCSMCRVNGYTNSPLYNSFVLLPYGC